MTTYIDDIKIFCASNNQEETPSRLQSYLNLINIWLKVYQNKHSIYLKKN